MPARCLLRIDLRTGNGVLRRDLRYSELDDLAGALRIREAVVEPERVVRGGDARERRSTQRLTSARRSSISVALRDRVGATNAPKRAASSSSRDTTARAVPLSSHTLKRTIRSSRYRDTRRARCSSSPAPRNSSTSFNRRGSAHHGQKRYAASTSRSQRGQCTIPLSIGHGAIARSGLSDARA